jgi:hypothetical protein
MAEAGDGLNLKGATWTAATEEMRQYTTNVIFYGIKYI